MPRASSRKPLQKHTLNLFEGDFEKLSDLYPELGGAVVIRQLIRKHIEKCEAALPESEPHNLEIEL